MHENKDRGACQSTLGSEIVLYTHLYRVSAICKCVSVYVSEDMCMCCVYASACMCVLFFGVCMRKINPIYNDSW